MHAQIHTAELSCHFRKGVIIFGRPSSLSSPPPLVNASVSIREKGGGRRSLLFLSLFSPTFGCPSSSSLFFALDDKLGKFDADQSIAFKGGRRKGGGGRGEVKRRCLAGSPGGKKTRSPRRGLQHGKGKSLAPRRGQIIIFSSPVCIGDGRNECLCAAHGMRCQVRYTCYYVSAAVCLCGVRPTSQEKGWWFPPSLVDVRGSTGFFPLSLPCCRLQSQLEGVLPLPRPRFGNEETGKEGEGVREICHDASLKLKERERGRRRMMSLFKTGFPLLS